MFKTLLLILALFISACGSLRSDGFYVAENLPEFTLLHEEAPTNDALIMIYEREDGKERFVCSAAVISKDYAVTAAHCLSSEDAELVIYNSKKQRIEEVRPTVAAFYDRMDIGLIKGNFRSFDRFIVPSNFKELMMTPTDSLAACGFPLGGQPVCLVTEFKGGHYFQLLGTTTLYPGMSGGPVFDLQTGTLIGVNSAVIENGQAVFSPLVNIFDLFSIKRKE